MARYPVTAIELHVSASSTQVLRARLVEEAARYSLRLLGFLLGGVTLAVSLMAFLVVRTNVEGHSQNIENRAASQAMVGYR